MQKSGQKRDLKPLGKQAEKSSRTRLKIQSAVMDLISEGGFAAASSTRIGLAAGVSWGVVQHHFGDKSGILIAVLEQCSSAYIAFMEGLTRSAGTRSERIAAYVDRCWAFYCGREYKIALEIALAMRFQDGQFTETQAKQFQIDLINLWRNVFPDAQIDDVTLDHLIRHTYIVLTGLVIDQMLESKKQYTTVQLQMLATTLEAHLYGSLAPDSGQPQKKAARKRGKSDQSPVKKPER